MGSVNSKGRRKSPGFVMVYHSMMDSPAWAHLGGVAVKLLLQLCKMSNGSNNGELFLSVRDAATALGVARNTAWKAFDELVDHGFLRVAQKGHFKVKVRHATTWRLTHLPCPVARMGPSNEWRDWRPEHNSRSQNLNVTVSKFDQSPEDCPFSVSEFETDDWEEPQKTVDLQSSNIATHLDIPRGGVADGDADTPEYPNPAPLNAVGVFRLVSPSAVERHCEHCGTALIGKRDRARFCSEAHRKAAEAKRLYQRRKAAAQ